MDAIDGLISELNVDDGMPPCFNQLGTFWANRSRSPNPCDTCPARAECEQALVEPLDRIAYVNKPCFGIAGERRRLRRIGKCVHCRVEGQCEQVVAELAIRHVESPARLPLVATLPISLAALPSPSGSASAPDPSTMAGTTLAVYSFPSNDPRFSPLLAAMKDWEPGKLMETLNKLTHRRRDKGKGDKASYRDIRVASCAISILLTESGWPAPRFRDMRKPPRGPLTDDDKVLSNDRQVVDLHWLRQKNHMPRANSAFQGLFVGSAFDFDLASSLVSRPGKSAGKARNLGLNDRQEWLLAAIQRDAVRMAWARAKDKAELLDQQLRDRAAKGGSKLTGDGIETRLHVFYALTINSGETSQAVQSYRMICGETITLPTMKKMKRDLENRHGLTF